MKVDLHNWDTLEQLVASEATQFVPTAAGNLWIYKRTGRCGYTFIPPLEIHAQMCRFVRDHVRPCV